VHPPGPGWAEAHPFPFEAARRSFTGAGESKGLIEVRYYLREEDRLLAATVLFGPRAEGAPRRVHGGAVLAVLDEAMGAAAWIAGHPVVTVRLEAAFRKGVPLSTGLLVETRLERADRRIVRVAGRLVDPEGTLYAEARGAFMRLTGAGLGKVFGPGPVDSGP